MVLKALWMQNSYLGGKPPLFFIFITLITLREQRRPRSRFSEGLALWGEALFAFVWKFVVGELCGFCWILFGFWGVFFKWVVSKNAGHKRLVYSKQSNVLLREFCAVLLHVYPVLNNKTFRRMRTQFLMLSIIYFLAEILILSFTYRNFFSFFIHKTVIPVVCFRLMLSSCL